MNYPSYNRRTEQQLTLSDFSGGIDTAAADTALAANQLRDAENVWWKDSVLQTRPGLIAGPVAYHSLPGIFLQATASETIFLDGAAGRLRFLIYEVPAVGGYALAVYFFRLDGHSVLIRQPSDTPDWDTLPTQLLPINDGKELGLVYVDALPYRLSKDGTLTVVSPYVPTVVIAARGSADKSTAREMTAPAGTSYEPFNRLTDAFKVEYLLTEGRPYFTLPSVCRHRTGLLDVVLNGYYPQRYVAESFSGIKDIVTMEFLGFKLVWSTPLGIFWFTNENDIVCVPDPVTWSSVSVTFTPAEDCPASRETVKSMRMATWFGGSSAGLSGGTRCFLAGSADKPSLLCYSAVQDATYFPENNDVYVGQPGQAITALGKQADMLVVFKEHEIWYSTYQTGMTESAALTSALETGTVVDVEAALATFPLANISSDIGCDRPATVALCDNRLVWTNSDGHVYVLVSGNIYSERNVRRIGDAIRPLLTARDLSNLQAVDYNDHYCLQVGSEMFLFDYHAAALSAISAGTASENIRKRIAWYRWNFPLITPPDMVFATEEQLLMTILDETEDATRTYLLSDGEDNVSGTPQPIRSTVRLPAFAAGSTGRMQSVRTVSLDIGTPYMAVSVLPIADHDDSEAHRRFVSADSSGIVRFLAGIRRAKRFSLQLQADGTTVLRSITLSVLIH